MRSQCNGIRGIVSSLASIVPAFGLGICCNYDDGMSKVADWLSRWARTIKFIPQARAILDCYDQEDKQWDDYIFPLLDGAKDYSKAVTRDEKDTMSDEFKTALFNDISAKTALLNKHLKEIACLTDIGKHLSFHQSQYHQDLFIDTFLALLTIHNIL